MENVSYIISYLGDNPPTQEDIESALNSANIDDEGFVSVDTTKPLYEVCDYCQGTGNEGTMNNIDCGNCGGSGWIKNT